MSKASRVISTTTKERSKKRTKATTQHGAFFSSANHAVHSEKMKVLQIEKLATAGITASRDKFNKKMTNLFTRLAAADARNAETTSSDDLTRDTNPTATNACGFLAATAAPQADQETHSSYTPSSPSHG